MNFDLLLLGGLISDRSNASLMMIGLLTLVGGIMLMQRHKAEIDAVFESVTDSRLRLFHQRKFRRRTLASTLIAAIGMLMMAVCWAIEPGVFLALISVILLLLIAVMFIAFLDLLSVGLHTVTKDDPARREMVAEYLRQRQKLLDGVEDSDQTVGDSK